ncbi:hypothetical protein B484DRAFT_395096 [Ochromonadaceae sp. CCMP2298]|nr:hypothetical protein B484DRAFT_395096 [Ochromonadaceae sp. CCMP2298]
MRSQRLPEKKMQPLSTALRLAGEIKIKQKELKNPATLKNHTQITAQFLYEMEERNALNADIKAQCKDFVASFDDVRQAEGKIGQLEEQIRASVAKKKEEIIRARSARERARIEALQMPALDTLTARMGSGHGARPGMAAEDANKWPVINAIMAAAAEQKQQLADEKVRRSKLQYQHELSDQIEKNKRSKDVAKVEKQAALVVVQRQLTQYEMDIASARESKAVTRLRETEMRNLQVEERRNVKEAERQQRIREEQHMMERARRFAVEEEEDKAVDRERQRVAQENLKKENETNRAVKMEIFKERQAYEVKLNADYEIKLEREENQRNLVFKTRMDNLAKFSQGYEQRVGARIQQQKADEERLVMENIAASERAREERDRADFDRRKAIAKRNTDFNVTMIERKRKEKEVERLDNVNRRQRMEMELVEGKRKDQRLAEEKRVRMLELRSNLDLQVTQRETGRNDMSSIEVTINRSIVKKMQEDNELMNKVLERVHPVSSRSTGNDTGRRKNSLF